MLGIIIEILISWALLKYFQKESLEALGFRPTRESIASSTMAFAYGVGFLVVYHVLLTLATNSNYQVNREYSLIPFLNSSWYVLKSVLFEELIFRGALLYILIKRIGAPKAIAVSSLCFGIYHWFSYGIFGQPMNMVFVFVITGLAGLIFAYSFHSTKSIYVPIALHLGYNFTNMIIFSNADNIGPQLLIGSINNATELGAFMSWNFTIVHYVGFPLLAYLFLRYK